MGFRRGTFANDGEFFHFRTNRLFFTLISDLASDDRNLIDGANPRGRPETPIRDITLLLRCYYVVVTLMLRLLLRLFVVVFLVANVLDP